MKKTGYIALFLAIIITAIALLPGKGTIEGKYYLYQYKEEDHYYDVEKLYSTFDLIIEDKEWSLTVQRTTDAKATEYSGTYTKKSKDEYYMEPIGAKLLKDGTGYLKIEYNTAIFYLKRTTINT